MDAQSSDGESVMAGIDKATVNGKHAYCKQMGKFVTCVQRSWLRQGVHVVRVAVLNCKMAAPHSLHVPAACANLARSAL